MHFQRFFFRTAILMTLSSPVLSVPTSGTDLAVSLIEKKSIELDERNTLDKAQNILATGAAITAFACAVDIEIITKAAACTIAAVEGIGAALIGLWHSATSRVRTIAESNDPRLAVNMVHNWPATAQQSTLKQLKSNFAGEPLLVAYHNCTGVGCSEVYYSHHTTTSGLPVHHLSLSPRSSTNPVPSKRQNEESDDTSEGDGEPELFVDYFFNDNDEANDESDDGAVAANTPDFTTQLGHLADDPAFANQGAICFDIFDETDADDEDSYGFLTINENSDDTYGDQLSQFMGICGGLSD